VRRTLAAVAAALFGIATFPSISFASGFALPEQDAAAMGMANAFVGQADNPSAVWYNPAGMTQLDGTRISGSVIGIYPVLTHDNTDGTTDVSKRDISIPFSFFATNKMNDKLSFGLGITNPFGLSTQWSGASETRYVATNSNLFTVNVNPNIAYKLSDNLSIAFGIDYVYMRATLENKQFVGIDENFRLSGDGDGWGVNIAAKYGASSNFDLGLSYRSRINVDINGTAELTGPLLSLSGNANTSIGLPDLLNVGASYRVSDNLTLNTEIDYTWWSTYRRIAISSDNPAFNQVQEKQWKDVWTIRIGGQYKLSEQWKARAGYLYDKNPIPESRIETRLPDSDRQGIAVGTGFTSGSVTIDFAYMYLWFNNRTINDSLADDLTPTSNALNGAYKSHAQLAGLTVGYKF